MKKWEYTWLKTFWDQKDLLEELNKYGKNGWELVSSTLSTASYILHIFKREIN